MPIVDGLTSTRMIRALERSRVHQGLSPTASPHGRIPVFAVSASLVERERDTYVGAGFDGWILKPIDFRRLEVLLQGINDDDMRDGALYVQGEWERGGWFLPRNANAYGFPMPAMQAPASQAKEVPKKAAVVGTGTGS